MEFVSEVIVSDGGSEDTTLKIARDAGATVIVGERGRGQQLRAGAGAARKPWLLFLHADTALERGWAEEAETFMKGGGDFAAAFRFRLADNGFQPRLLESRRRSSLQVFRAALWRPGPSHFTQAIRRRWRLRADPADGGRGFRAQARAAAYRNAEDGCGDKRGTLPPRWLRPAIAEQSVLPYELLPGRSARAPRGTLWLSKRRQSGQRIVIRPQRSASRDCMLLALEAITIPDKASPFRMTPVAV